MINRRLLCLALNPVDAEPLMSPVAQAWDICNVSRLEDAARELRNNRHSVGLLVYDRRMGLAADFTQFLRQWSQIEWIGIFEGSDLATSLCRDLIAEHLCDYHTVPVDPVYLGYSLGHAHGRALLYRAPWSADIGRTTSSILGNCEPIRLLRDQIDRVAKVSAPVLLWGESGSGKELAAQAIHARSDRLGGPLVPVNCGAIAPSLIQSELFGYERGAFTGATRNKIGLIESANGGTLFLDEIGDLPKELQANLLRFLQEKTICRLGGTVNIHVDVRVVAASHVDLQLAVADGTFREDLYYRLAVLPVTVPSLRERRDDLVMLAEHFFCVYAHERSPKLKGFSDQALNAILAYDWPGNVRELINRVRCALVMSNGRLIKPEDLALVRIDEPANKAELYEARTRSERTALLECLERNGQNISLTARHLGVSRTTMYRLLDKHHLRNVRSASNDSGDGVAPGPVPKVSNTRPL